MASTGKCPYCGSTVSSDDEKCPSCGAPNQNHIEDTPKTIFLPKTIDELKEYCAERGMPLLRMRFFIGEDFREPKAFGIYQDGHDFVVYKNKADGSRAVRYRGPDEAHAVDELFRKLLDECHNRGIYPDGKPAAGASNRTKKKRAGPSLLLFWVVVLIVISIFTSLTQRHIHRNDGYYTYNETVYYNYGGDWYASGYGDWYYVGDFPADDYQDYYSGEDFDSDWGATAFEDSDMWEEIQEAHSSSSDDYDSWDSGGTDWDSDW